ncbi:MAG: hypothetical protein CME06_17440 [Gemmatimonadetes bacterium]|nr:hypothetical protein [Gemmatimonadota bacterium]
MTAPREQDVDHPEARAIRLALATRSPLIPGIYGPKYPISTIAALPDIHGSPGIYLPSLRRTSPGQDRGGFC